MKNFNNETGEQAINMNDPTEGLFEQGQVIVKILCVTARFTASFIVKIQPESTSLSRDDKGERITPQHNLQRGGS
ncbi:hypothetical protein KSF_065170 [Reticulibacter mediterranei]|uniref:Uncharacterized protein n=1 Tax=Reticulibacter mediterranei TaxID=2778369 RepID=A0A8J3IR70_9CHLR|nr:hypothetical protein [Reticulibacter mediterranei]GHO96469.1 hypothetical protein KSF_065170 [Reticulibacter mediterranei]